MPFVNVKNLIGAAGCPNCVSWLKHWEEIKGSCPSLTCSAIDCSGIVTEGAYVRIVDGESGDEYIVPVCRSCSMMEETYAVDEESLASADVKKTCGKGKR